MWNLLLMQTAATGVLRIGETVSLGAIATHQAETAVRWVGHPASWPVNLVYAWRNDVGPSRYDLLSVNAFLGDPAPMGASMSGWTMRSLWATDGMRLSATAR
jgi:hypothetical protein